MAAPPGMEALVLRLKKDPSISNPWAVAWSIYNKRSKMSGTTISPESERLLRSLKEHHNMLHRHEVGLPVLDPGNYEFKTNPFKVGVEAMSDIGAPRGAVPGSYEPGGGWFRDGEYHPGGGYWALKDGRVRHSPRNTGARKIDKKLLSYKLARMRGLPPDNLVAAEVDPNLDPFKMGVGVNARNSFKMGLGVNARNPFKMGSITPYWWPGGGAYDKYTGQYIPGGGWNRQGRRWVHSSQHDDSLITAPGVEGWPREFDSFKVGAPFVPRQIRRRLAAAKRKGSVFQRLKKVPWMKRRKIQRAMAAKLLKRVRQNDPRAKAALARIRQLAASNGNAQRLLRDIAQIAVCWKRRRAGVSGWPRTFDSFKLGHETHSTGCAVMEQIASRR